MLGTVGEAQNPNSNAHAGLGTGDRRTNVAQCLSFCPQGGENLGRETSKFLLLKSQTVNILVCSLYGDCHCNAKAALLQD